jgi:site-specific recombinase XerD
MSKNFFFNPKAMRPLCSGPLTQWLDSFAERLVQQGYSDLTCRRKMRLVADLSRWLGQQRLTAAKLNEQRVAEYLRGRWRRLVRKIGDKITPRLLLHHLRQLGVVPAPTLPGGAVELLLRDYRQFLIRERGFAPGSVAHYVRMARSFLADRFPSGSIQLRRLAAHDVSDFILRETNGRGRRSAQLLAAVLRSFLTYLFQKGRTRINLASAVPSVAGWRLSELPRYLESAQVEQVLRSCDRRCKVGKRDYAMLLLFARLGLRVGEVARLALTDIDWRAGELRVQGKGGRVDRLPLPTDVGQAIVDYLRKGRPRCSARLVFIQGQVPHVGFADSPASLCGIVRSAMDRARIQGRHGGAHVLRHSLATRMLAHGGSLAEIGRVLRHQHIQTTEIYAKVDLNALRAMTHPWPGGAQ